MQIDALKLQNIYLQDLLDQATARTLERDVADRIQKVLTEELHHRMKNMLTMVAAIVQQSMRTAGTMVEAEDAITTRLVAMSSAHDLLLKADLETASLTSVVLGAVEQHNTALDRIVVQTDLLRIIPSAIVPMTLLLNELCTNATKYGALSKEEGRVLLSWDEDAAGENISFRWVEKNGPAVVAPSRKSFGSRLIEALPRQLGGKGTLSFAAAGVEFELLIPRQNLAVPTAA